MSFVTWTTSHPKPLKGDRLRADRATAAKAALTLGRLYRAVYKRDRYRCVACHKQVQPGSVYEQIRAHPHHIIPRSLATKAEKHTMANICCLCPLCHADIGHTLFISGNADKGLKIRRTAA